MLILFSLQRCHLHEMSQFRVISTLAMDEGSKPYAPKLVKEINYKGSIDIIQLKGELLTYLISL